MSNSTTTPATHKTTAPDYLGWRSELLAQLALARLPKLTVFKPAAGSGLGADYLVASADGFCFFAVVQAFSSIHLNRPNADDLPELDWGVDRSLITRAKRSRSPVVLFLFDADTDHGRFSRLDSLPIPRQAARSVRIQIPIENTITRESLERLVYELQLPAQQGASKSSRH